MENIVCCKFCIARANMYLAVPQRQVPTVDCVCIVHIDRLYFLILIYIKYMRNTEYNKIHRYFMV